MEGAKTLSPAQAFYLLRHLITLDFEVRSAFQQNGFLCSAVDEQLHTPGSKFLPTFCSNPWKLPEILRARAPQQIIQQANGRTAQVYRFEERIGTDQIIALDETNRQETHRIIRNGLPVRAIHARALPLTNSLVLILSLEGNWITAFPGTYAPPLPQNGMSEALYQEATDFWEKHAFVVEDPVP